MQTLLELGELTVRTQLELSVLWNRNDIAYQILSKNDKGSIEDIEEFLTESLVDNKLDFIKVFVEKINLNSYLTKGQLEKLYIKTLNHSTNKFLLESLKKRKSNKTYPLELLGAKTFDKIRRAILLAYNIKYIPQFANEKTDQPSDTDIFKYPEIELFVYSLLFVRLETSEFFWNAISSKASSALFAVLVLKAILNYSGTRLDMKLQLKIQAMLKIFEGRATGIVNYCNDISTETCHKILKAEHPTWGEKACLDLAVQADCKDFIAQSGCQTLVREVWFGELSDRNAPWKVFMAAAIPLLVPLLEFKNDAPNERDADTESKPPKTPDVVCV